MFFTSDNASGAAPEVMAALLQTNDGYTRGYGAEEQMARVTARLREVFEHPEAAVYLVATGTVDRNQVCLWRCPVWSLFSYGGW